LGSYETGNYLPVHAGGRAFLGHGPETVNADQKRVDVARFFDAATEDDWRRDLLQRYDVDYVFWGPVERDLGEFDPGTASYLRRVHEAGAHVVFLVEL
jgi:uncharacterized membrane protein